MNSIGSERGTCVSYPVAPPPDGGYPPPQGQYPPAPQSPAPPGQPYPPPQGQYPPAPQSPASPGQPYPPAPGQYPPPPGQYPPGPAAAGTPDLAPASRKGVAGRILLRIGLAVVVLVVGFIAKSVLWSATDKAKDAAAGDCIASNKEVKTNEETDATAKVVDCASTDAAFTVVAKIPGETDTKSKSCDKYFKENEEFFVYSADNGATGYLLCLRAIKNPIKK